MGGEPRHPEQPVISRTTLHASTYMSGAITAVIILMAFVGLGGVGESDTLSLVMAAYVTAMMVSLYPVWIMRNEPRRDRILSTAFIFVGNCFLLTAVVFSAVVT